MTDTDTHQPSTVASLERAVEAAGHAIFITDPDGTITYVNPAFENITGYGAAEAIGRTPTILNSGEHAKEYYQRLWETILAGDVWKEEIINRRNNGDHYIAHQTIAPVTSDGDIEQFVAIQTEITDQKAREDQLRQYKRAIEETHDLIAALDTEHRYLFANNQYRLFHGIEQDTLVDTALADVFDADMLETVEPYFEQALDGEVVSYRMTRSSPTTGDRTFDIRYYPLEGSDGTVDGVVVTMRDISDLVDRQRELERNRDLLAHTEQMVGTGGWEYVVETQTLRWTDGTRQLHAVSDSYEPSIDDAIEFFHPDDQDDVQQAVDQCRKNGSEYDIEARLVTADGRTRWVRTTGERCVRNGKIVLHGAIQDITTRKQREQRLMVLNRILRHNLRNNLSTVMGYADLLEEELTTLQDHDLLQEDHSPGEVIGHVSELADLSTSLQRELATFDRAIEHVTSFPFETALTGTKQIKESSRELIDLTQKAQQFERSADDDQIVETVAVQPILEDIAASYRDAYPAATIEVTGTETSIQGTEAALRRILDELVENALSHSDQESPTVTLGVQTDESVRIRVVDTGAGLPEIERQTISEGEETSLMHGSGIGLWLVNWLVTRLGGAVTIEDNEPRGTIVTVEFPAVGG